MRNELNSLSKLNSANDSLNQIRQVIVNAGQKINWTDEAEKYKSKNIGVIERVKVLYSLGGTHLAITILFILIELLPLLTKLMSNKGGYDKLILEEENDKFELARIGNQKETALKNELQDLENQKYTQKSKIKLEIEKELQEKILKKLAEAQNEIAIKRIEEFRKKNIAETNIPNIPQPIDSFKLEDKFWKQKGSPDKIEYYFRNGSLTDNELLYFENDHLNKGKWNYNSMKDEVEIELLGNNINYSISEITKDKLKLTDTINNDILELERV